MRKRKISRELLTLAILTVLTVFSWVGFEVQRTLRQPPSPKIPQEQLLPLDPNLNTAVLDRLSKREVLGKEELNPLSLTPTTSATESGKTKSND